MEAAEVAFGSSFGDSDWERERVSLPAARAQSHSTRAPRRPRRSVRVRADRPRWSAAVCRRTWVGVLPTHRRRGILRRLMAAELADIRAWGEPIAALWASEPSIYGRFGYGIAAQACGSKPRARASRRDDTSPTGSSQLVTSPDDVARYVPRSTRDCDSGARACSPAPSTGGAPTGSPTRELAPRSEPEVLRSARDRRAPTAYADYRVKNAGERGYPKGRCASWRRSRRHREASARSGATSPASTSPRRSTSTTPTPPRRSSSWCAIRAPSISDSATGCGCASLTPRRRARRTYRDGSPVVLGVRDVGCPWNEGNYRVDPLSSGRGRRRPGARRRRPCVRVPRKIRFVHLAPAERVRELKPGAVERASDLFRTPRPPYCPEVF